MLRQRVLTALVLAVVLVWLLFFQGPIAWSLFVLLAGGLAAEEWARLGGCARTARLGYAAATLLLGAALLGSGAAASVLELPLLAAALLFWALVVPLLLWRGWRIPAGPPFLLVGWLVILPTLVALALLRRQGVPLLLASMALIWVSDVCAYFVGRAFGRHRLAPAISPGKTWEGVAGALAGVLLFGALLGRMAPADSALAAAQALAGAAWWPLLALLVALGIEGDLFESWLKRCAGLKDSGWILPGHGGVLDRIDALTAALPVTALLLAGSCGGNCR